MFSQTYCADTKKFITRFLFFLLFWIKAQIIDVLIQNKFSYFSNMLTLTVYKIYFWDKHLFVARSQCFFLLNVWDELEYIYNMIADQRLIKK